MCTSLPYLLLSLRLGYDIVSNVESCLAEDIKNRLPIITIGSFPYLQKVANGKYVYMLDIKGA